MPTVGRSGPYRLYFYSDEGFEPAHIHVERDDLDAKFWILPVELAGFHGFGPRELRVIEKLVIAEEARNAQAWRRHFGG
ncbi:DUF4160 domain-containing protein [soil metagenome]